jgi:hypothetical protein
MKLPKRPRADLSPEPRRQGIAGIASGLLWAFALGFAMAAVQVARALWSHKVWTNYRGEVISATTMRYELVFFIVGAIICGLVAWQWYRIWRRQL